MMDRSFVEAMEQHFRRPMVVKVNGIEYLVTPSDLDGDGDYDVEELPEKTPMPTTLALSTLESVIEYVKTCRRDMDADVAATTEGPDVVVHVVSPRGVRVLGPLTGHFRDRPVYAEATTPDLSGAFAFGKFMSQAEFVIAAQIGFVPSEERSKVLQLVGTMKASAEATFEDDGITQTVTASEGTHLAASVQVPNPVMLAPYRTFNEVTQPVSPFILRVQGGNTDAPPKIALFPADGGKWQITAVAAIHEYLTTANRLPAGTTVYF